MKANKIKVDKMKEQIGYVICKVYNYKGKQYEPISVDDSNGIGISGYIYIYVTKLHAKTDLQKISVAFGNDKFIIKKVAINDITL